MTLNSSKAVSASNRRQYGQSTLHPLRQGPQEVNSNLVLSMRKASKTCLTEFTQRVMSGKLLQLKQYQNQLAEAISSLKAAREENRGLARLVKRQEIAISRFEGENAGMPRLIRSHAEEVRTLRSNAHQLKSDLRSLQVQLREKDSEVLSLKEALAKLQAIAEDKHSFDRVKAEQKTENLENLVEEQRRQLQVLSRKILLDSKQHQRMLCNEVRNHKETKENLEAALVTIARLEKEKRSILLGYTTSSRPTAHHCSPPVSRATYRVRIEPKEMANQEHAQGQKNWLRRNSVVMSATPQSKNTDKNSKKSHNFLPAKPSNSPNI